MGEVDISCVCVCGVCVGGGGGGGRGGGCAGGCPPLIVILDSESL